jgi:hypothetical protein
VALMSDGLAKEAAGRIKREVGRLMKEQE